MAKTVVQFTPKELKCLTCEVLFLQKRKDRPNQKYCSISCSTKNLHRKEIIQKRSKTVIGSKRTEATKLRMSEAKRGKQLSEEHRKNLSKAKIGIKLQEEHKKNIGLSHLGKSYGVGRKLTDEHKNNLKLSAKRGKDSPVWVNGNYKKSERRYDSAYLFWLKQVKDRDGWKCKIDKDCCGQIEVHHILSWREYKELRYEVNNGITLCHAHHPRKHSEEDRLSPYFTNLIKKSI